MTEKLRVTSIKINDVLGAREFAMEPGQINVISGRNGSGKTSTIEAVKNAIGGGNLAKLSRVDPSDEVEPEIVLVLDSEEGQKFLLKKNTKGTSIKAQVGDSAGFEDLPKPQRWLDGLVDNRASNPIQFLNAPDKERILIILGALPVTLDREVLWIDMGIDKNKLPSVPIGLHPLQELALIREAIFRERTGINRDAKAKAASAEQTRRATPAVVPDGHEVEIAELETNISNRDVEIAKKIEQAKSKRSEAARDAEDYLKENKSKAQRELADWAADKRSQVEGEILSAMRGMDQKFEDQSNHCKEQIAALDLEHDRTLEDAFREQRTLESDRTRLAELREQAKNAIKVKTLHEQAEQFDGEAAALLAFSEQLSDAIAILDKRRASLAQNLPIEGLEINDKEIKVHGVPFDQLNTAQKIKIAVKVACLRARDQRLPVVWVDGAEALDAENFAVLKEELRIEGVQAFIGYRDDEDLKVSSN